MVTILCSMLMYGTCFAAPSDQKFNAFVDTEYYTINVPDSWKDDCLCNIADGDGHSYTLTFYDKLSREKMVMAVGSFLFVYCRHLKTILKILIMIF